MRVRARRREGMHALIARKAGVWNDNNNNNNTIVIVMTTTIIIIRHGRRDVRRLEARTQGPPRGFQKRGDDTVGNPHRAEILKFELIEFIIL